jgi:nondiscriminating aspartyl-tRNA synthetase
MERTLIRELKNKVEQKVTIKGWVNVARLQGKMAFFDFRDRTGKVQGVVFGKPEVLEVAQQLKQEWVVAVTGLVHTRPDKMVNETEENGMIELEITSIIILAQAESLPFDMSLDGYNLDLTTELDHRALTLRHPRLQSIFKVQSVIIDSFREFMKKEEFFEFQAPSITPATAEGGAEVFQVNYFDKKAYLTQSPQLYKQIVMTAFERVFSVNKVFRAEPSATTRHITEIVSLDAEMAFIESWEDVRKMSEDTVRYILAEVAQKCSAELILLNTTLPTLIEKTPTYSLTEAQELIFEKTGRDVRGEKDLNPEDERTLCDIVKKETDSDFVYVYGYPTRQKPFYVSQIPKNLSSMKGWIFCVEG